MTFQKDAQRNEVLYLHKFARFEGKRVLEVGCGDGRLTWRYASEALHVTGIDLEPDDLRVARIERSADLENTVALARADSIHLPFRDNVFDMAILAWSF